MSPKKQTKIETPDNPDQYTGDVSSSSEFIAELLSILYKRVEENRELSYENSHDDLTGLYNRKAFRDKAEKRMDAKKPFAVIFLDLDAFKLINDTFGHRKGNEMLKNFADHMMSNFRRPEDVVSRGRHYREQDKDELSLGRLGGDEFGIIDNLDRVSDGTTLQEQMEKGEKYTRNVVGEFVAQQSEEIRNLGFGISLGGAIWNPDDPVTAEELIHQADLAMQADKQASGRPAR
jgi:diguanylate cyclase (GGDEF)-like protein